MYLTSREKEILDILKQEPMISQVQLAEKLNITRSCAAVHITNLIKKGYIQGKGYIVKNDNYVTVIGGANIDIQGFPSDNLTLNDSNPGKVEISLGGVARNIAENLVKLGINVKLISAVGNDMYGNNIINESKLSGINTDEVLILKNLSSSTYLSILDEKGDMKVAISHMDIYEHITVDYIRKKSHILKNSSAIILDTNISKDVIEYILFNFKDIPIFIDTVSTKKSIKIKDYIGLFHTIKPNKYEAEILSNIKINNNEDLKSVSNYFLDKGVKNIFISLGKDGVFFSDGKTSKILFNPQIEVVNTTGAGDSFIAGVVYSYLNNFNLEQSAEFAMCTSLVTISHKNTVNPTMSVENVINKSEELTLCSHNI